MALGSISFFEICQTHCPRAYTLIGYMIIIVLNDVACCWPWRGESEIRKCHILNKSDFIQGSLVNAIERHFSLILQIIQNTYIWGTFHFPKHIQIRCESRSKSSCLLFFIEFLRLWEYIFASMIIYFYGVQICFK